MQFVLHSFVLIMMATAAVPDQTSILKPQPTYFNAVLALADTGIQYTLYSIQQQLTFGGLGGWVDEQKLLIE